MDPDDLAIDDRRVARLLREQAPQWADLPLRRLASTGTDNAVFRLGDDLALRLPRRRSAVAALAKELDWLPRLQGLPLELPVLRFRGRAGNGADFGVLTWVAGEVAEPGRLADPVDAARRLARFLEALHLKDSAGAPPAGPANSRRGVALRGLTGVTRPAIEALRDEIDASRAHAIWEAACAAGFAGRPVWLHGDIKADNLIARDGVLRGVIDWGLAAVGDPAADYASAWSWVDPLARDVFRDRLELARGDWSRAQGWALYAAAIALSHYRGGGNEALCRQSRGTLSRLGLLR